MGQEKATGVLSDDAPYFGDLIRAARHQRGLSVIEVAYRAGMSRAMVGFIEGHKRLPTFENTRALAEVLNLNPEKLLLAHLNALVPDGYKVTDSDGNSFPCRIPPYFEHRRVKGHKKTPIRSGFQ